MLRESLYPSLDVQLPSYLDESLQNTFRDLQEEAKANELSRQYFFSLLFERFRRLETLDARQVLEIIKICKNKNPALNFHIQDFIELIDKKFELDCSEFVIKNEEDKGAEAESKVKSKKINYSKIFKTVKKWIGFIEEMKNLQLDIKPFKDYIHFNICNIDISSLNFFDITDMIKDYEDINKCLCIEEQPILLATLLNNELDNIEVLEILKNTSNLANKEELLKPYKKYDFDESTFRSAIQKVFDINCDEIPKLKERIERYKIRFPVSIEILQLGPPQPLQQEPHSSPSISQIDRGQSAKDVIQSSPLIPQINRSQPEEEKRVFAEDFIDRLNDEFATTFEEIEPFDMNNLEIKSWKPLREIIDIIVCPQWKLNDIDFYIYKMRYYKPNGRSEEVIVKCHISPNLPSLERYKREADIMAKAYSTGSASFIKILGAFYDMENEKNRFTLIMESCKWSLKDEIKSRINERVKYSEENIMKFLFDMLNACRILIDLKIIHRDIKPANIFVDESNGELIYKIGDFDASLVSNRTINTSHSTRVGVVGTEIYMAPEIYKAHEEIKRMRKKQRDKNLEKLSLDMRERKTLTDVFSLGLTVLEMVKLNTDIIIGLNCCEQEEVNEEIDSIEGFDWLKPILKDMLAVDYHHRLSFGKLFEKYYEVLKIASPKTITD